MNSPSNTPRYERGFLAGFVADLRSAIFRHKTKAAEYFNLHHTTVGRYENIESRVRPPVGYLAALAMLWIEQYVQGDEALEIACEHLLKDVNRAIRSEYYLDTGPLKDWADLIQAAQAYLAKQRRDHPIELPIQTTPKISKNDASPTIAVEITKPIQVETLSNLRPGSAPPVPSLIIGRESDLQKLKKRLGVSQPGEIPHPVQALTAIRGWAGVGKTSIASALAHDIDIVSVFPDGILWISLGEKPNLLSEIAAWGRALGTDELLRARSLDEASALLRALLRNKRALLIIDDVWEVEHAIPFNVGGRACATLITTRLRSIADTLAPTPESVYLLPVLKEEDALELISQLAPDVVSQYPDEALELVRELEGLPLALQVAGRLLHSEAGYGFGVNDLIIELQEGAKLLAATAPPDRADMVDETTPTVAVLLQKSVERLKPEIQDCYAYLGVFAPKPATFDLVAMKAVWHIDDPVPVARILVGRGLLEYVPEIERYQMHAVLVMHAKSLLT